jgi:uncharacterized protein YdeI (YjbR/CyaY-like superfamily)
VRLVPKFLSRRRKKGREIDANEGGLEDGHDDAVDEDERIEVRTERVRDADAPIELKIDVPEEAEVAADESPQDGAKDSSASGSKSQTREELVQEALANRAKAKKIFDDLSPETRERIFSAVLGPDWKSQYEDDA